MIEDIFIVDTVIKNTWLVVVPCVCVQSNNKRFGCKGVGEVRTSIDVAVTWDKKMTFRLEAKSSYSLVRVLWFKKTTVFLDIIDGYSHGAAHTSSVIEVTVDELLFWEALELAMEEFAGCFETSHCRERPARSAFSLILDWSDSSWSSPVNVYVWNWCIDLNHTWFINFFNGGNVIPLIGEICLTEFFLSKSRELIDSSCVGFGRITIV